MQVMARAENTVFLGVEVKETNLEIFNGSAHTAAEDEGKEPGDRAGRGAGGERGQGERGAEAEGN